MPPPWGNDLSCLAIHRELEPLRVRLLLDATRHCVRFNLQALHHDVLRTAHGLPVQMIRPLYQTLYEKAHEPRASHTYRPAHPPSGQAFEQHVLDAGTRVIREEEVRLATVDTLASAVVAAMRRCAVVPVTVLLTRV